MNGYLQLIPYAWSRLSPRGKWSVALALAGMVAVVGYRVYDSFLSTEARLAAWDENYKQLCHSADEASPYYNPQSYAQPLVDGIHNALSASIIGRAVSDREIRAGEILCIDLQTNRDADPDRPVNVNRKEIYQWGLYPVTIVADWVPAERVAARLSNIAINKVIDNLSDDSADYTPGSALFWSRYRHGLEVPALIDSIYRTALAQNSDPFNARAWTDFKPNTTVLAPFATMFEDRMRENGMDRGDALFSVMGAVMHSDLLDKAEYPLLKFYWDAIQDVKTGEKDVPNSNCGTDKKGNVILCKEDVYGPPPASRNSMTIKPETLITLASVFFDPDDNFMTQDRAQKLMTEDELFKPRTRDGLKLWRSIMDRIGSCCDMFRNTWFADEGISAKAGQKLRL